MSKSALIVLAAVLLLAAGTGIILRLLGRSRRVQRLLVWDGPLPHLWGLLDLLLILMVTFFCRALAELILVRQGLRTGVELTAMTVRDQILLLLAGSVAALIAWAASCTWLAGRYGRHRLAMGLRRERLVTDISLGIFAFFVVAPIVYTIQRLLAPLVQERHPFVELLLNNPDPILFGLIAFSAVIVAPITEEFLFRVVLQGWFERIAVRHEISEAALWGGPDFQLPASSSAAGNGAAYPAAAGQQVDRSMPVWPILLSSVVFALFHLPHGPAPIPLFFFALALGYLYQRTHSILPCLVLHVLLNACSLALFCLYVLSANESP